MSVDLTPQIAKISLFEGLDPGQVLAALREVNTADYKAGDYICRRGEYEETCSIILGGAAAVLIPDTGGAKPKRIPVNPGEIFGEIAAMSGTPRTADVIAETDVKLLRISRDDIFNIIDRFRVVKERLDAIYLQRALSNHLSRVPIFASLSEEMIEKIRGAAILQTFRQNEAIFNEGDDVDAFYLIRYGFVKVSRRDARMGERVLAYLNEGSYFGEMALIEKGRRTASISALNRAEVIKIAKADFDHILEINEPLRAAFEMIIRKRRERNEQIDASGVMARKLSAMTEGGLIQSKALLLMDLTKCVQCDSCVKACAALHGGDSRLIRKGMKLNDYILLPTSCRNCSDPVCMSSCPTGAIKRNLQGEIYHEDYCIGCGSCARLCPHGNIAVVVLRADEHRRSGPWQHLFGPLGRFNRNKAAAKPSGEAFSLDELPRVRKRAVKCDLCKEYEFMGCVYNCPTGAARHVNPVEYFLDFKAIT